MTLSFLPRVALAGSARLAPATVALSALLLSACASAPSEPAGAALPETVWAVTDAAELIRVNAGQPQRVLARVALQGLPAGERLVGIDFRVARGVLYALSSAGRLYTLDTASGRLQPVGSATPVALQGSRFGVDFNPVADRIRVVSDTGQNLRLHPDTGAVAADDPALKTAAGAPVRVTAAGYTYNKTNDRLTTNYAIDTGAGTLVTQGSIEGVQPVVSPNTGQIATVGALGTGAVDDAAFDIGDVRNTALAALRQQGRTRLWQVDLATGRATLRGTLGEGRAVWGLAIEP